MSEKYNFSADKRPGAITNFLHYLGNIISQVVWKLPPRNIKTRTNRGGFPTNAILKNHRKDTTDLNKFWNLFKYECLVKDMWYRNRVRFSAIGQFMNITKYYKKCKLEFISAQKYSYILLFFCLLFSYFIFILFYFKLPKGFYFFFQL